jgi:signal peptidase I
MKKTTFFFFFTLIINVLSFAQTHIPDKNFANAIRSNCKSCITAKDTLTDEAKTLKGLSAQGYQIKSLKGIEGFLELKNLSCYNNELTSLPALPQGLIFLYCYNNQLTSLPLLPKGLTYLDCENNQLTSLSALPKGLTYLDCENNLNLKCIDLLPESLKYLNVLQTQIKCLPNKPKILSSTSNLPICNDSDSSLCFVFPKISGNIFIDYNDDGIKNNNDVFVSNRVVEIKPYGFCTTNHQGDYSMTVDTAKTLTVKLRDAYSLFEIKPSERIVVTTKDFAQSYEKQDFRFIPKLQTNGLSLTIHEAYNFNVGDIFEFRNQVRICPSSHPENGKTVAWKKTIKAKQDIGDKIIYTIEEKKMQNNIYSTISTIIYDETISQLDSSVFINVFEKNINDVTYAITDSTFNSPKYGGGIMSAYDRYRKLDDGDYSENSKRVYFMEGLGMVYNYAGRSYTNQDACNFDTTRLVYYKKGSKTWGDSIKFNAPRVYSPMVAEGAQWLYYPNLNIFTCDTLFIVQIKGDSTVGTKKYKKVFFHELKCNNKMSSFLLKKSNLIGLIREELINEKVFFRIVDKQFKLGTCLPDEEFLLYSFNNKDGETLDWCQFGKGNIKAGSQFTNWGGQNYKGFNVIDGSTFLPLFQKEGFRFGGLFYQYNYIKTAYRYCLNPNNLCVSYITKNADINNEIKSLQINNNQKVTHLAYQLANNSDNFKIKCFNSLGQVIEERKINILEESFSFSPPNNQFLVFVLFQGEIPIGNVKSISF